MGKMKFGFKLQVDTKPFDEMAVAFGSIGKAMRQYCEAISSVLGVPSWLIDTRGLRQRLDEDGWQSVNPHELNIEDRWTYQKWVLYSPKRWWKRILG